MKTGINSISEELGRLKSKGGILYSFGTAGKVTALALSRFYDMREDISQMFIIVHSGDKAKQMEEHLSFFCPESEIFVLPEDEMSFIHYDVKSRVANHELLKCLSAAKSGRPGIYIAPVMSAARILISPERFESTCLNLKTGDICDRQRMISSLSDMGYERVEMTDVRGQFSVRGDVVDIFPPDSEYPYRIDFFDDEIDALKTFDPLTQRSVDTLDAARIIPAVMGSVDDSSKAAFFWDYLSENVLIAADEWDRICEQYELEVFDMTEDAAGAVTEHNFADMTAIVRRISEKGAYITTLFNRDLKYVEDIGETVSVYVKNAQDFKGKNVEFADEVKKLLSMDYSVTITCSNEERREIILDLLQRQGILGEDRMSAEVSFQMGVLSSGFILPESSEAFYSDNDLFKLSYQKRRKRKSKKTNIALFSDLKENDYVVHENHGIGKFVGIFPLETEGKRRDYLKIKYAGSDELYVPVENLDRVQKYIGSGANAPKLNSLSGTAWKKTKAKAQAAIQNMAKELVRMTAERKLEKGHAFAPDCALQKEFEEIFPYVETDDQLKCIEEVKRDMEMPWPMDRLLCGDVGFGKTEVAARAVFKCVLDGKQAAVLVPTTLLADQHYRTFHERFAQFPCTIECMSRFKSAAELKKIAQRVSEGKVDILIGTHRILSSDVRFKDLGLLVIDEEQRFGVKQKEAVKLLKKNVDVLSLSATPIPRTLHMSLSGIRSMSTLDEPIMDRKPVQTFVLEQNSRLIREIILREKERNGQVFIVYNRVKGIMDLASDLQTLVPEARMVAAHGQMTENKLEKVMRSFVEHEYDVLISTTIVETGIDVPNANTLIVLDADMLGLSQLYQLRGRVGRSSRKAYAYLMYRKNKILNENAEKRLEAIKEFTEFGSSFKVAMKDLEIRGAGNLLGTEQSGHMMMIGYELYCKLINEAVRQLRGEDVQKVEMLEVTLDIKTDAYISSEYISDESMKIDMYKRIADIRSAEDVSDVTDELIDRFGEIPGPAENLIRAAYIKALAQKAEIKRISVKEEKISFEPLSVDSHSFKRAIPGLMRYYGSKILINVTSVNPHVSISKLKSRTPLDEIIKFLEVFNTAETE